jgi:hypothetical protein
MWFNRQVSLAEVLSGRFLKSSAKERKDVKAGKHERIKKGSEPGQVLKLSPEVKDLPRPNK